MTNLDLPVVQLWNLYNGRADCENRIKELKQDYGLESFCLKDFWATEASFRSIMLAYNLMMLFQHAALNILTARGGILEIDLNALYKDSDTQLQTAILKNILPRDEPERYPWI